MLCMLCRMVATLTKIGEGAFADVFGYQKEGWDKLALKVFYYLPVHVRLHAYNIYCI